MRNSRLLFFGILLGGPLAWATSPFQSVLKIGDIRLSVESEMTSDRSDSQAEVLECMTAQLLAAKEFALEHQALARSWLGTRKPSRQVDPFRLTVQVSDRMRGDGRSEVWNAEGLTIHLSSPICEALSKSELEALVRSRLTQKSGVRVFSGEPIRKTTPSLQGERRLEAALQAFHQAQH